MEHWVRAAPRFFSLYSDAPQTKGVITTPEPQVYQLTRTSLERGFQVCTHAIGDAANRMVLDAYANALKSQSGKSKLVMTESSDAWIDMHPEVDFELLASGDRFLWTGRPS